MLRSLVRIALHARSRVTPACVGAVKAKKPLLV
jgi:hypothetical protein